MSSPTRWRIIRRSISSGFTTPKPLSPIAFVSCSAGRPIGATVVARALDAARKSESGVVLSSEQLRALRCALRSRVAVITGGPGTGKTTLLRSLLAALDAAGLKPTLAAPTGRAARRLAEASGREANTIHRLLEYAPETGEFLRNEQFPLRTNYLVVDEASMMDIELAASLPARTHAQLIVAAGWRSRPAPVGRPRQRAERRYRFGSGAVGRVARGLSPGAREPDRLQRPSAESRRDARRLRTTRLAIFSSSSAPRPRMSSQPSKELVQKRLVGRFGDHGSARDPGAHPDESRAARHACAQSRVAGPAQSARTGITRRRSPLPRGRSRRFSCATITTSWSSTARSAASRRFDSDQRPRSAWSSTKATPNTISLISTNWASPMPSRFTRARAASIPRS